MGFKDRLGVIMRSEIGDWVTRAEDPQKIINQVVEEMDEGLKKAKARIVALKYKVEEEEKLVERLGGQIEHWQGRAKNFIEKGMDENAREAIRKKRILENEERRVSEDLIRDKAAFAEFEERFEDLEHRVMDAKSRRVILLKCLTQNKETSGEKTVQKGGVTDFEEAFSVYSKMEERITNDREAGVFVADTQSSRLKQEEKMIDEELENLKKDIKKGGSSK